MDTIFHLWGWLNGSHARLQDRHDDINLVFLLDLFDPVQPDEDKIDQSGKK